MWNELPPEKKWQKDVVLATLQNFHLYLPTSMKEEVWNDNAPDSIRNDRDVIMRRLETDGFQRHFVALYSTNQAEFRLPDELLSDKEVVVATMHHYPEILIQNVLPENMLDDCDVFLAYVRSDRLKHPHRAGAGCNQMFGLTDLVPKFSERIRSDKTLLVEAAARHCHVWDCFSPNLVDSCSFAMDLFSTYSLSSDPLLPADALTHFSKSVCFNKYVVLEAVEKNGLNMQHASESLRGSEEIILAACKRNPKAVEYCTAGVTRRNLFAKRGFIMSIFDRLPAYEAIPSLYPLLSSTLQNDWDVIAAAKNANSLAAADLPFSLTLDTSFWMWIVGKAPSFWYDLPNEFKDDPAWVKAIGFFRSKAMVQDVFDRFPLLAADRGMWHTLLLQFERPEIRLALEEFYYEYPELVRDLAPIHIRLDRELMLGACAIHRGVLELLAPGFQEDLEFLQAIQTNFPMFLLEEMTHAAQRRYPALTVKAIGWYEDVIEADDIAPELWENLDIVEAYWEHGYLGEFHTQFPETLKDNKRVGLLVAQYCPLALESATSEALRGDKVFMTQVISIDTRLLEKACGSLCRNFDLNVLAFGIEEEHDFPFPQHRGLAPRMLEDDQDGSRLKFLRNVLSEAQEKIVRFEGFAQVFLYGFLDEHSPIFVLSNRKETSMGLKKMIYEFVGVPLVAEYPLLRRAVKSIRASLLDN